MKAIVKSALSSAFPGTALRIFSARARRAIERFCEHRGLREHALRIAAIDESKVLDGPFKGMRIDYSALPVHTAPKYVGTYEKEIIAFVEDAINDQPEKILNVGSSDGYYAVGLADPDRFASGTSMPSRGLTPQQIDEVVATLKRLDEAAHHPQVSGVSGRIP
jgi:hypothetical protein